MSAWRELHDISGAVKQCTVCDLDGLPCELAAGHGGLHQASVTERFTDPAMPEYIHKRRYFYGCR